MLCLSCIIFFALPVVPIGGPNQREGAPTFHAHQQNPKLVQNWCLLFEMKNKQLAKLNLVSHELPAHQDTRPSELWEIGELFRRGHSVPIRSVPKHLSRSAFDRVLFGNNSYYLLCLPAHVLCSQVKTFPTSPAMTRWLQPLNDVIPQFLYAICKYGVCPVKAVRKSVNSASPPLRPVASDSNWGSTLPAGCELSSPC